MVKTGNIVLGKTPSVVGGAVSSTLVDSEPVTEGETAVDPGLKKLGNLLDS